MQRMCIRLAWINVLIVWDIRDLSRGHGLDVKSQTNGVRGVLEEAGDEFWGPVPDEGPFERQGEDSRKWMDYVNAKEAALAKKMSHVQSLLLEVQKNVDPRPRDKYGKMPVTGESAPKDAPSESHLAVEDVPQTLKKYLRLLRNWSAYLEDVKANWNEEVPVEYIHEITSDLEGRGEIADPAELVKLSGFLTRKKPETRKEDAKVSCNETNWEQILLQVQKNLSETFLYKNITLKEVGQMSKIVDFVERYRGQLEKIPGPDVTDPETPTEKFSIVDTLED